MRKLLALLQLGWQTRADDRPPLLSQHLKCGQDGAQLVPCLLSMQEGPGSILSTHKLTQGCMPLLILTLRWWGWSGVQGHPWINRKFEVMWLDESLLQQQQQQLNTWWFSGSNWEMSIYLLWDNNKWDLEAKSNYHHELCLLKELVPFGTHWSWLLLFNKLLVFFSSRWSWFVYPLTIAGLGLPPLKHLLRKRKFIERGPWLPRIWVNMGIPHRQTEGDFFSEMIYKTVAMPGTVMQDCNPQYLGGRDRRTRVQGQPVLHSEFQVSLDYVMRSYLERKKKWKKGSPFFSVSLFLSPSLLVK